MLSHFNKYCFTGIIGKPGSGKTSLLISWLTSKNVFKKCFHHVVIIMPKSSIKSMKSNPFKDHPEEKCMMNYVGASLKNNEIKKKMRELIYNRRHLKCSIMILLQSYLSLEKEIRKLFNNVIMFKPSKVEFENLFNELFETKKEYASDIMEISYDGPHNYLMLNVDSQKMYKGFDEIIIKESNDEENNNLT